MKRWTFTYTHSKSSVWKWGWLSPTCLLGSPQATWKDHQSLLASNSLSNFPLTNLWWGVYCYSDGLGEHSYHTIPSPLWLGAHKQALACRIHFLVNKCTSEEVTVGDHKYWVKDLSQHNPRSQVRLGFLNDWHLHLEASVRSCSNHWSLFSGYRLTVYATINPNVSETQ